MPSRMQHPISTFMVVSVFAFSSIGTAAVADDVDVKSLSKAINNVGPKGEGHQAAIAAWQQLSKADAEQVPAILAEIDPANALAVNWMRAAVDSIVQRAMERGDELPTGKLTDFLLDTGHAPKARRAAYELLLIVDPSVKSKLIPQLLNDPSMELRRDAVADALAKASSQLANGDEDEAIVMFQRALDAARDQDQVDAAAEQLRKLGQTVDLPTHFGFITSWHLIAPFDNTDKSGFDVAYGPERKVDLDAEYQGKDGVVKWTRHSTDDQYGTVDLNEALGKFKGAVAYAYAEFESLDERSIELRLGCINANKVWLNGELLTANEVYHSNTFLDQYIGRGRLKQGTNSILLKICQNEQTESWAQRWQFQLRVCDELGTAVLSQE